MKPLKRLLITGAAGQLGAAVRNRFGHIADKVRLSDVADFDAENAEAETVRCDLADYDAVQRLVAGCDGVVHLGGVSVEDKFSKILKANIEGVYNLYEAARKNGSPRILFASSNHVIGFHSPLDRLDNTAEIKPDGLYGVSKSFGEATAKLYHAKFGIETAIVRIGSCFPEPKDRRMLSTWLSHDDFVSLVVSVFRAPLLGCPVIYGVSANDAAWWDNSKVSYLGWQPQDNAERFRAIVEDQSPMPGRDDPAARYQGGKFTTDPIFE
ncbi:MAG: NAD(P)-dependent oxidoreductase [Rhizobiaceae bacterium]|nr:NAD(P)-dependent oxidoreductase [Rhizobiaceae bacterium]